MGGLDRLEASGVCDPASVNRANAYHLLSQALKRPDEMSEALPGLLCEQFQPFGGQIAESAVRAAKELQDQLAQPEALSVAYAKLFMGPFEIKAPPYASWYLEPEGRLMGPVSDFVAHAYAEVGLRLAPGPREASDHIVLELEYFYFLVFQEVQTDDLAWGVRQRSFWNDHLGLWLPRLAQAISAANIHPYYSALADLLHAFAGSEDSVLAS